MRTHIYLREIKASGGGALGWVFAVGVLVAIGALVPDDEPPGRRPASHVIRLRANRAGHFYADIMADGVRLHALVDTGATTTTLPLGIATRMGFGVHGLAWNSLSSTANGVARSADVKIKSLTIGGVTFHDVNAIVTQGELDEPLLGIDWLNSVQSYHVENGVMTISF